MRFRAGMAVAVLVVGALVAAVLTGCSGSSRPAGTTSNSTPVSTGGADISSPESSSSTGGAPTTAGEHSAYGPPFIAGATWVAGSVGASLHVAPTTSGRKAPESAEQAAWAELIALVPRADTATMRQQFDCHWRYARVADPAKPTWNLEPWRKVVSEQEMVRTGCNPGGPD